MWHTLGLKAEGNRFTISFNDVVLFTAIDQGAVHAGRIALWTKADSVTAFDGLEITALR